VKPGADVAPRRDTSGRFRTSGSTTFARALRRPRRMADLHGGEFGATVIPKRYESCRRTTRPRKE